MKERDQLRFVCSMIKSGRHMVCTEMGVAGEILLLVVGIGIIFLMLEAIRHHEFLYVYCT